MLDLIELVQILLQAEFVFMLEILHELFSYLYFIVNSNYVETHLTHEKLMIMKKKENKFSVLLL